MCHPDLISPGIWQMKSSNQQAQCVSPWQNMFELVKKALRGSWERMTTKTDYWLMPPTCFLTHGSVSPKLKIMLTQNTVESGKSKNACLQNFLQNEFG